MFFSNFFGQLRSMIYVAPVVLLAIVFHECAHGYVSDRLGDPTPRMSGRLTLNPLKNLDPLGTICMLFFHIGWANPVPINPMYYRDRRKGIIHVSLAGPVTNFVIAFISLFLEGISIKFGAKGFGIIHVLSQLCYYSAVVNIGLGIFNLIPIPPLDGSKVLGEVSYQAQEFYRRYDQYWRFILMLLIFTGILSRPLNMLNNFLLSIMMKLVRLILFI